MCWSGQWILLEIDHGKVELIDSTYVDKVDGLTEGALDTLPEDEATEVAFFLGGSGEGDCFGGFSGHQGFPALGAGKASSVASKEALISAWRMAIWSSSGDSLSGNDSRR